MPSDTVITAKLVRGKNYAYFDKESGTYYEFQRNVPKEIPERLADELEDLVEEVSTTDGDKIEKPIFDIDRDAERRTVTEAPKRKRLRLVEVDEADAPKRPIPRRPIPGKR